MNKLHEVVQKFRSGSVDSDKALSSLDDDKSRTHASSETGTKRDYPASSPRHPSSDAVWVTNASHPSPFSPAPTDAQGHPVTGSKTQGYTTGYLSDLSLQNTPITGTHKTTALTAQELHDSVLSALGEAPTSPVKSPTEKKPVCKKPPAGTFEYTVKEGDTLVKIGAQFDLTPSELMRMNKLVSRTVFVGQVLFIPDPKYKPPSPPTPKSASPVPDSKPKLDIALSSLPTGPGHAVPVTSPTVSPEQSKILQWFPRQKSQTEDEPDKECLQKFLKMPARRVLEEYDKEEVADSEGFTVRGTLLVTPNAVMFDPDVSDPIVIDKEDNQLKFSVVVYMEEIKSVALFHDVSPRMFWKQSKELPAYSPKPETYHSGQSLRPTVEGHVDMPGGQELAVARLTPDGASVEGDSSQHRASPEGRDAECKKATGRASEELEHMTEMSRPISDMTAQPGRTSEEVEHALTSSQGYMASSPVIKQMSHSSELEVCEISQLKDAEVFGETRDFGPHMGRSSSEVHRHTSSSFGRFYDASPADVGGHSIFHERSDSTSDNLNTPTQGFAPVHFTDRSPMTVTTHPKPVPGQRLVMMSQSPDLKSEQNKIAEDSEIVQPGRQLDISVAASSELPRCDSDSLSDTRHSEQNATESSSTLKSDSDAADSTTPKASTSSQDIPDAMNNLASQVSDLSLASTVEKQDNLDDESAKTKEGSPRLPFSPLRTPAQHISSFFNYTSSFFRSSNAADKDDTSGTSDGKGKYSAVPSVPPCNIQLKSGFTSADISKAFGPDPKEFLLRLDSHHFEESPLYLQIRRGVQKDKEPLQPRAFDHRNVGPMLDEYWFVVPREMGDKLYNFLMEWQPEAYGDEVDKKGRDQFFYDVKKVENSSNLMRTEQTTNKASGDGNLPSDDFLNETEKTWEILSKEEVYRAEKEQALRREDAVDESSFPELIGPTVIITEEHIRALMKSLPRNMSVGYNWELVYATHKHGYSLHNLYMRAEEVDDDCPVLLFIKDTYGCVFGAYLSNTIRPNDSFYGSGATFLFTFYPTFKKFPWQGSNQFFMHGTKDFFAVGSGEGLFGLWFDGDLDKGCSHACTTFDNDVLTKEEDFSILQLEVWKFVDSSLL